MLEGCKSAKERWGGVSEIIDRWLNARQELIVLYCSINGVNQFHEDKRPIADKLKNLCQLLVDYASAGHFEVYEQLVRGGMEFDNESARELAKSVIPQLEHNTQECLHFHDGIEQVSSVCMLQASLSVLGENLAERFSLEDKMIEVMYEAHREKVF